MKNTLLFVCLLSAFCAEAKPPFDERCRRLRTVWETIWDISDYTRKLAPVEETGEIVYREDDFNRYLKRRKGFLRVLKRSVKDFRKTERAEQFACFRNALQEAVRSADKERILSQANLYIQMLPKDSLHTKLLLYTRILLPVHYDRRELTEIFYIYKILEGLKPVRPADSTILRRSREYVLARYRSLQERMPLHEYLKGMWVSSEFGKKHLPDFIVHIIERDSVYYAVLSKHSAYLKKQHISYSVASPFLIDSADRITLQYHHIEKREGMSRTDVQAVNTLIDAVGQGAVKSVYKSSLSSVGKSGIGAGIQFLSALLMSSVGNSSVVTRTNRSLYLHLRPGPNRNLLSGDFLLKKSEWLGDPSLQPNNFSDNGLLRFYRLNPDDEIVFAGKKAAPIVYPCRSAYFHPEGYAVYKKAWKHRATYRSFRSNPLMYYPLFIIGVPAFAATSDNGYNKRMQKILYRKYNPQPKKSMK